MNRCMAGLRRPLSSPDVISNIETLNIAAIAIMAAEENVNPFEVQI